MTGKREHGYSPCTPCLIGDLAARAQQKQFTVGYEVNEFKDATLVLIGHGSTLNAESADPTYQHADELRRRGIFAEVLEAFWKQEPCVAGVLRGTFSPRVFVVP